MRFSHCKWPECHDIKIIIQTGLGDIVSYWLAWYSEHFGDDINSFLQVLFFTGFKGCAAITVDGLLQCLPSPHFTYLFMALLNPYLLWKIYTWQSSHVKEYGPKYCAIWFYCSVLAFMKSFIIISPEINCDINLSPYCPAPASAILLLWSASVQSLIRS